MTNDAKTMDNSQWRATLTPEQFRVLRGGETEPAGSGTLLHESREGTYGCVGCGAPLFAAATKFDSGCGWPAFFDSIPGAVVRREDRSGGMLRTEITCARCGGHLGHVFRGEGFPVPTDERHCVNSVSLSFKPSSN